jgi:hypothetical protein
LLILLLPQAEMDYLYLEHDNPVAREPGDVRAPAIRCRTFCGWVSNYSICAFLEEAMHCEFPLPRFPVVLGSAAALALAADVQAADLCSGHKLLRTPRPELSCRQLKLQIHPSPDGTLRAVIYPADISLDATPDMESRVVIRTSKGATLNSKDYSSPRGFNGYYVVNAKWSPDSKFFVYSMSSSGGHSPWQFPMAAYGREAMHGSEKDRIVEFGDLINGNPTVSPDFEFTGPHTVKAITWKQPGSPQDKVPVTVDLQEAFNNLPR